jgi:hypothetical protein
MKAEGGGVRGKGQEIEGKKLKEREGKEATGWEEGKGQ